MLYILITKSADLTEISWQYIERYMAECLTNCWLTRQLDWMNMAMHLFSHIWLTCILDDMLICWHVEISNMTRAQRGPRILSISFFLKWSSMPLKTNINMEEVSLQFYAYSSMILGITFSLKNIFKKPLYVG